MLPVSPRELTNGSISSASIDPYQVLQIRRDATTAEIKQAYKRLALLHHPVRRKGRAQQMQLFEVLAACYETLMDKDARLRCDLLLQDQEKALLHRTLTWKGRKSKKHKKVVGLLMKIDGGNAATPDCTDNMLGFVGLNTMPSLAEISSCGGSSMDESFLTQEDHDWKNGCVAESHHVDGQEQVEIVYSLDSSLLYNNNNNNDDEDPSSPSCKYIDTTSQIECEKDRCASPATTERSTLRPLRILQSQQPSWEEEDSAPLLPNPTETPSFDSVIQQAWSSHSTDNSSGNCHEEPSADVHYTGAEIDRIFGGPLQLLFRARRWQVFKDPFEVFAEVFGGPLYGDVPLTLTLPKKGPSIRTAFQLPPPMEKLPSEHVSRRTTIHRTRRVALGKEIIRTAVVRIDPCTGQRHVTISVTTEDDVPIPDEEDPQLNSFFQFLDSLCVGSGRTESSSGNGSCFCFDFSICT